MITLGQNLGVLGGNVVVSNHIGLISALSSNGGFLNECISNGYMAFDQTLDLHFLGIDLTMTPSINPVTIFKEPGTYLPLLIFPILVVLTQVFSMQFAKHLKPGYKQEQEAKKRAKNNPAREGQVQENTQAETTMKIMNWTMPLIMLYTTFIMPAAMGLYWIVGGIMGIITQVIVYYMFTKPYELKKAEIEAKKEAIFKKKAQTDASGDKKGKKNSKKK